MSELTTFYIKNSSIVVHNSNSFCCVSVGSGMSNTGRPRIPPGRGGLRNESFRGRGNYGGGWGYGRNDYGSRGGDFSGRGRAHGEGYHQGRGRGGRSSGPKQNTVSN